MLNINKMFICESKSLSKSVKVSQWLDSAIRNKYETGNFTVSGTVEANFHLYQKVCLSRRLRISLLKEPSFRL